MDIQTFFNPYDVRHLKAFKVLNATGAWPAGFIPDNVVLGSTWQVLILNKMALAWLEQAEAGLETCASEPGKFCSYMGSVKFGQVSVCRLFPSAEDSYTVLTEDEPGGWVQRCPECLKAGGCDLRRLLKKIDDSIGDIS